MATPEKKGGKKRRKFQTTPETMAVRKTDDNPTQKIGTHKPRAATPIPHRQEMGPGGVKMRGVSMKGQSAGKSGKFGADPHKKASKKKK